LCAYILAGAAPMRLKASAKDENNQLESLGSGARLARCI
jgi:hypothetical protein